MTDQVCCREHLAVYNLLQFLIEPPDGKTYHVVVIAFDFLYMDGEIPLYAVSSGFVEGIAGFYVNVQVVLVDGIKGHVRLFVKCADGDLSMLSYDDVRVKRVDKQRHNPPYSTLKISHNRFKAACFVYLGNSQAVCSLTITLISDFAHSVPCPFCKRRAS